MARSRKFGTVSSSLAAVCLASSFITMGVAVTVDAARVVGRDLIAAE